MKHFIITVFYSVFFFFHIAPTANSQDCKLCGDWVGITTQTYDHKSPTNDAADWRPGTVTHYLRIEKYGNQFKIRTKRHYKDREDGGIVYDDADIEILKTTDTSIYYKEIGDISCNYDQYDRITDCDRCVLYILITYHSGYVHFKLIEASVLRYNQYKQYTHTTKENPSEWYKEMPNYDMDYFRDKKDW